MIFMLYLFTGDDTRKKRLSYEKFIKSIQSDVEIFFINKNNFDGAQLESLYSGSSLFFVKCAVVFSNILETEENRGFLLKKLEPMHKSDSFFIFLEGKLNKPVLDAFKKNKVELNVFELPKEKKEKFNNFLLANAFEKKDKLNLWINYRLAVDKGVGLEELIGVLFWKIKDMFLKRNFGKFSPEQLQNFSEKLSYLLPEARKKGHDPEIAFEQFLLEVF